jgi:hypothetical protein
MKVTIHATLQVFKRSIFTMKTMLKDGLNTDFDLSLHFNNKLKKLIIRYIVFEQNES